MRLTTPLTLVLCAGLALASCASVRNSRLNPFNLFGRSTSTTSIAKPRTLAEQRLLVAQVTDLVIEPSPGGVIVRATGLPPTQGYWEAELVPGEVTDGTIAYDFRVFPPVTRKIVSSPRSREIEAAAYLSNAKLAKITEITVQGAANARTSRR